VQRVIHQVSRTLERWFPEKRLFLRSETETRFVRLSPVSQLFAWAGIVLVVGWTIVSTAFLLMDSIGAGSLRAQARREQALYEKRLNELSLARNESEKAALSAQERFNGALDQISRMQAMLLDNQDRLHEMETGIDIIQTTLRRTMRERDSARAEAAALRTRLASAGVTADTARQTDTQSTVDFLTEALRETASQRDTEAAQVARLRATADEMELERKLLQEKNDRIFSQLEDAVSLSLEPLDKMFKAAGLSTETILKTVRQGYSGQGGPLAPISFSTRGRGPDADSLRANAILERLDRINLYRIAAQKVPFALPVHRAFRYTSGFGMRWGRMHEGVDLAAPVGTPLYATADGVVSFAGQQRGYGNIVIIQHGFGLETRYAHQSRLRVKKGQRVSRGERIGDMGNTGHSTGPHVHYEIRLNGKPINPMTFIKAARNVF